MAVVFLESVSKKFQNFTAVNNVTQDKASARDANSAWTACSTNRRTR